MKYQFLAQLEAKTDQGYSRFRSYRNDCGKGTDWGAKQNALTFLVSKGKLPALRERAAAGTALSGGDPGVIPRLCQV